MSLKGVHLLLIAASTLLMLAFAGWCLQQYREVQGVGLLLSGTVSLLGGIGLGGYAVWFASRKMRTLP
jgi:hypothetical protein